MYYLNLSYRWTLAEAVSPVNNLIFLPCGSTSERILRVRRPVARRVLFDPQAYLAGLNAEDCTKTCARLATYPWFGVPDVPTFDSSEDNRRDWEQELRPHVEEHWPGSAPEGEDIQTACREAIEFQLELSCSSIILPSPLIGEREDEAQTQTEWLDVGLGVAEEFDLGQPLLATIAVDEAVLNGAAFEDGGFLDGVVDHVVNREGLDGVYIVVSQTHPNHPFEISLRAARAYLHLVAAFHEAGTEHIITNFADLFSFVGLAAGATAIGSGASHNLRRLSLRAFRDAGGGTALPYFYSHQVAAELATERDLDLIVKKRLVRRIRTRSPFGDRLMEELGKGGSARTLPAWAESRSNTKASTRHFVHVNATESRRVGRQAIDERWDTVRDWLESAIAGGLLVKSRTGDDLRGRFAPVNDWLELFDEYLSE